MFFFNSAVVLWNIHYIGVKGNIQYHNCIYNNKMQKIKNNKKK